jgi:hypothetical protein
MTHLLDWMQIQCIVYISIFSWVYVNVLTNEDMVLWWWYRLLSKIKNTYILKPILTCEYCVSGQIALWTFFFFDYNIFSHLAYITSAIFVTHLIKTLEWKLNT